MGLLFLFLYTWQNIEADDAGNQGCECENFAQHTFNGADEYVINKPAAACNQYTATYDGCVFIAVSQRRNQLGDDDENTCIPLPSINTAADK